MRNREKTTAKGGIWGSFSVFVNFGVRKFDCTAWPTVFCVVLERIEPVWYLESGCTAIRKSENDSKNVTQGLNGRLFAFWQLDLTMVHSIPSDGPRFFGLYYRAPKRIRIEIG